LKQFLHHRRIFIIVDGNIYSEIMDQENLNEIDIWSSGSMESRDRGSLSTNNRSNNVYAKEEFSNAQPVWHPLPMINGITESIIAAR
jgi:hypothetical protein